MQSLAPGLEAFRMADPPLRDDELGAAVLATFEELFWGALAAPRVLDSFRRLQVSAGSASAYSAGRAGASWCLPLVC